MRTSDTIKAIRSYVVFAKNGELFVKPSHWKVGYTEQYKATPDDAITYAQMEREAKIEKLEQEIRELETLRMAKIDD